MYETIYHRPSSVDEAAALFAKGADSKYLAGGHTLIPVMKQRLASPSDVIDLGRIKELVGIELSADALTIKAATTYFDILQSADASRPSTPWCSVSGRCAKTRSARVLRSRRQGWGCGRSSLPPTS